MRFFLGTILMVILSPLSFADAVTVPAAPVTPTKTTKKISSKEDKKIASVKYKKSTSLEFDGRNIDGNVMSPDSSDVEGDKNIKFDSLLDGRKDFMREFKRSSGVNQ